MTLYEKIDEHGVTSRGKTQMLRHLNGEKLTRNQSIAAKCFDCMGWYQDGRLDCRMPNCPLYPFRSYKEAVKPVLRSPAIRRDAVKPPKKEKATDIATKTPKRLKRPSGHSNAILRELESIVGVNKRRK
jgi:hypothetical protein